MLVRVQTVNLVENLLGLVGSVGCHAGKDKALGKCTKCKGCNNAEVVAAAAKSKVEIRIARLRGSGDCAIGEYNLD